MSGKAVPHSVLSLPGEVCLVCCFPPTLWSERDQSPQEDTGQRQRYLTPEDKWCPITEGHQVAHLGMCSGCPAIPRGVTTPLPCSASPVNSARSLRVLFLQPLLHQTSGSSRPCASSPGCSTLGGHWMTLLSQGWNERLQSSGGSGGKKVFNESSGSCCYNVTR